MITGQEEPDAGTLRVGDTCAARLRRPVARLPIADKNVWEEISGGMDQIKVGEREVNSRKYVADFNFRAPTT